MFKKIISLSLIVCFLSGSFFKIVQAQRLIYKVQCNDYKTIYNYDKTKLTNYPLGKYLLGLDTDPDSAFQIMNIIKSDRNCIEISDIERKISLNRSDNERRILHDKLAGLISKQNELDLLLKIKNEKIDRISKFLQEFRVQSKLGSEIVNKNLIDKKSKINESVNDIISHYMSKGSLSNDQKIQFGKILLGFRSLDSQDFDKKKNVLLDKVIGDYKIIKEQIYRVRHEYNEKMIIELDKSLGDERNKFIEKAKLEFVEVNEYKKALDSFDDFVSERRNSLMFRVDSIYKSIDLSYKTFEIQIENIIGKVEIDEQASYFQNIRNKIRVALSSKIPLTLSVLQDFNKNPEEVINHNIDGLFEQINENTRGLIDLMQSGDFNLLKLLNNDQKTVKWLIGNIQDKNYEELEKSLDTFNKDVIDSLTKQIESQKEEVELLYLQQLKSIQDFINNPGEAENIDEYLLLIKDNLIALEQDIIKDLPKISKSKIKKLVNVLKLPVELIDIIIEIANKYGGYGEYIASYFSNLKQNIKGSGFISEKELNKALIIKAEDFKNKSLRAFDYFERELISDDVKVYKNLSDDSMNVLKFYLLTNVNFFISNNNTGLSKLFKNKIVEMADNDKRVELEFEKQKNIFISYYSNHKPGDDNSKWDSLVDESFKQMGLEIVKGEFDEIHLSSRDIFKIRLMARRIVNNLDSIGFENMEYDLGSSGNGKSFEAKTYGAYKTDSLDYYINLKKLMLLTKTKDGIINSIQYFDSSGHVIKQIHKKNKGIVTFYDYDNKGRLKEEIQADAFSTWNKYTQNFDKPIAWNEKIKNKSNYIILKKISYSHVGSSMNIKEKKEFSPNVSIDPDIASKITLYHYLYGDLKDYLKSKKESGSSSGEIISESLFDKQLRNISYSWFLESNTRQMLEGTISRIELKTYSNNSKKYKLNNIIKFFYSDNLKFEFIQEGDEDKYIFKKEDFASDEKRKLLLDELNLKYNKEFFDIKGIINISDMLDIFNFIDADGSLIIEDDDTVSSIFKSKNYVVKLDKDNVDKIDNNIKNSYLIDSQKFILSNYLFFWQQVIGVGSVNREIANQCLVGLFNEVKSNIDLKKTFFKKNITPDTLKSFKLELDNDKDLCNKYGMPISSNIEVSFKGVKKSLLPTSLGAKFSSPNKYNFWISNDQLKEKIQKEYGAEYAKYFLHAIKTPLYKGGYLQIYDYFIGPVYYDDVLATFGAKVYYSYDSVGFLYLTPGESISKSKIYFVNDSIYSSERTNVKYSDRYELSESDSRYLAGNDYCFSSKQGFCNKSYLGLAINDRKYIEWNEVRGSYQEFEGGFLVSYDGNDLFVLRRFIDSELTLLSKMSGNGPYGFPIGVLSYKNFSKSDEQLFRSGVLLSYNKVAGLTEKKIELGTLGKVCLSNQNAPILSYPLFFIQGLASGSYDTAFGLIIMSQLPKLYKVISPYFAYILGVGIAAVGGDLYLNNGKIIDSLVTNLVDFISTISPKEEYNIMIRQTTCGAGKSYLLGYGVIMIIDIIFGTKGLQNLINSPKIFGKVVNKVTLGIVAKKPLKSLVEDVKLVVTDDALLKEIDKVQNVRSEKLTKAIRSNELLGLSLKERLENIKSIFNKYSTLCLLKNTGYKDDNNLKVIASLGDIKYLDLFTNNAGKSLSKLCGGVKEGIDDIKGKSSSLKNEVTDKDISTLLNYKDSENIPPEFVSLVDSISIVLREKTTLSNLGIKSLNDFHTPGRAGIVYDLGTRMGDRTLGIKGSIMSLSRVFNASIINSFLKEFKNATFQEIDHFIKYLSDLGYLSKVQIDLLESVPSSTLERKGVIGILVQYNRLRNFDKRLLDNIRKYVKDDSFYELVDKMKTKGDKWDKVVEKNSISSIKMTGKLTESFSYLKSKSHYGNNFGDLFVSLLSDNNHYLIGGIKALESDVYPYAKGLIKKYSYYNYSTGSMGSTDNPGVALFYHAMIKYIDRGYNNRYGRILNDIDLDSIGAILKGDEILSNSLKKYGISADINKIQESIRDSIDGLKYGNQGGKVFMALSAQSGVEQVKTLIVNQLSYKNSGINIDQPSAYWLIGVFERVGDEMKYNYSTVINSDLFSKLFINKKSGDIAIGINKLSTKFRTILELDDNGSKGFIPGYKAIQSNNKGVQDKYLKNIKDISPVKDFF